jgi:predicted DNA-binding transcriptional regulator AlpA
MSTKYLTTDEVAEICRTSVETVRFWRWKSTGPKSFKVGRRVLYAVEDVDAWLEDARRKASAVA